jgi:hypothetical protein
MSYIRRKKCHHILYTARNTNKKGRNIEINVKRAEGFFFGKWYCQCGKKGEEIKAFNEPGEAINYSRKDSNGHFCYEKIFH